VGSNRLIADGAKLITCAEDILVEYQDEYHHLEKGTVAKEEKKTNSAIEDLIEGYSGDEKALLRAIGLREAHIDDIISESGLESGQVLSLLTIFEISGIVEQKSGKIFKLII